MRGEAVAMTKMTIFLRWEDVVVVSMEVAPKDVAAAY